MEGRLLEAACAGKLDILYDSFREDPWIFHKLQSWAAAPDTPLHLASMFGHADFVLEYIKLGSITTQQLCQLNRDGYSPFHLASANGHVRIVKHMLEIGERSFGVEELCMKEDKDGRTALHCAVAAGKIEVIDMLLEGCSKAAMEVSADGDNVVHIAVKHHQYEALELLIQKLDGAAKDLLNMGDRRGSNVLHLATAQRQLQAVEYLVKQPGLDVNAKNSYGYTALDIISACGTVNSNNNVYVEEAIRNAGGFRSVSQMPLAINTTTTTTTQASSPQDHNEEDKREQFFDFEKWKELRNGIIVMASIVLTLTFQVALTPPGGLWQDSSPNTAEPQRKAGHSILYNLSRKEFIAIMVVNFQAFFAAIGTIIVAKRTMDPKNIRNMLLIPIFVDLTAAFLIADFLTIMSITTAGNLRLFRQAEFLAPLICWITIINSFPQLRAISIILRDLRK